LSLIISKSHRVINVVTRFDRSQSIKIKSLIRDSVGGWRSWIEPAALFELQSLLAQALITNSSA
jgi:hypothetical protein